MTKYLRKISTPSKVGSTQIIDSLTSTSKIDALSADAGRRLNEKIDEGRNQVLDMVYPIGSLYISYTNTSPASLFGGTWEQIKDTFLLACGDTYAGGSTGGSTTHNHGLAAGYAMANASGGNLWFQEKQTGSWWANGLRYVNAGNSTSTQGWGWQLGGATDNTNTMPPYLAVYVWKRVEDRISITNKTFNYVNRDLGNKDIEVIEETLTINKSGLITLEEGVMDFE